MKMTALTKLLTTAMFASSLATGASATEVEEAPVAKTLEVNSASNVIEGVPIAQECKGTGCDHQPAGADEGEGTPIERETTPHSTETSLVTITPGVKLNAVHTELILSFKAPALRSSEDRIRVECSDGMGEWQTAWEGNVADANAGERSFALPFTMDTRAMYYRVMVVSTQ